MTKPVITFRNVKGTFLTFTELDTNFTNLRDATITLQAHTGGTNVVSDLNGVITLVAGTGVTITGDNTAKTITINSPTVVVDDTTPQLGGDLDVNGFKIVSVSNGNIAIDPNGSGHIILEHGNTLSGGGGVLVGTQNVVGFVAANGVADLYLMADPNNGPGQAAIRLACSTNGHHIYLAPGPGGYTYSQTNTNVFGNGVATATISSNGARSLVLNTNTGGTGAQITLASGTNASLTLNPAGTSNVIINETGTGLILARRSASSGTYGAPILVQRRRSDVALTSTYGNGSGVAFGIVDNVGTQAIYGRLTAEYQGGTGEHLYVFEISTNNFTTPLNIGKLARTSFEVGQNNPGTTFTINNATKTKALIIGQDQIANPTVAGYIKIGETATVSGLDSNNINMKAQNYGYVDIDCFYLKLSRAGAGAAVLVGNGTSLTLDDGGASSTTSLTLNNNSTLDLVPANGTTKLGNSAVNQTITTNGAGNLTLNTNSGTTSPNIELTNNDGIKIRPYSGSVLFETTTGTDLLDIDSNRIFHYEAIRGTVSTGNTVSKGGTYTPPATDVTYNEIEITNTGSGTSVAIDVTNLTVANEGGMYAFLIYNNAGSNMDLDIKNNGNTLTNASKNLPNGSRHIATVYCVGNYASCEVMDAV